MRLFFIVYVFYLPALVGNNAISLDYIFKLDCQRLLVELSFQEEEKAFTEIELPIFFDSDIAKEITDIQCYINGNKYEYKKIDSHIQLNHKPLDKILITYTLVLKDESLRPVNNTDAQILCFFGDRLLLTPNMNSNDNVQVTFSWVGLPCDWKAISSFGINKKQEIETSFFNFKQSLFSIGNLNISSKKINGNNFYIVTPYTESASLNHLEKLVVKIVSEQRNLWRDFDFPFFFMLHVPTVSENDVYGEAKLNSFLVSSKNIHFATEEDWANLSWVISHEHFHTWLPYKMLPSLEENFDDLAWLIEGFTEYYAMLTAYRAGVLSIKQVLEKINFLLLNYHSSPVKNVTNDFFIENRYLNYELQKLPYQRGFILALLWEEKMKFSNQNSLDDFMRNLFDKQKNMNNPISLSYIEEIIRIYIDQSSINDIQDYIIEGNTLPVPLHILGHSCLIEWIGDRENIDRLIPQLYLNTEQFPVNLSTTVLGGTNLEL